MGRAKGGGGGYFGKLPDRADFVTGACPAGFLRLWEPFLVRGLAQSKVDLNGAWEEAYMTMPVWRYWLKPESDNCALKQAVAGALMPSVDKVGREFPLTFVAPVTALAGPRPPELWYDSVEKALRFALDDNATLSAFQSVAAEVEPAVPQEDAGQETGAIHLTGGSEKLLSEFWCRAGSNRFSFRALGLPEAHEFRWLLLPETRPGADHQAAAVGDTHGQHHPEDHRT